MTEQMINDRIARLRVLREERQTLAGIAAEQLGITPAEAVQLAQAKQEIATMKQYVNDNHRFWWFSSTKMTIYVVTDTDNRVTDTAAIAKTFIGQPVKALADWMRGHGGFEYEELKLEAQEVTA